MHDTPDLGRTIQRSVSQENLAEPALDVVRHRGDPADPKIHVDGHQFHGRGERAIVLAALEANDWVIGRTARALGLSDHSSLIKIMNRLGVRRPAR